MSIQNALASIAVSDLRAAQRWYEKLLEKPASLPMPEVAEWHFERGGGLQIYELPERAGSGSLTLAVDDLDGHVRRLERLNIDTHQRTEDARVRTVMIRDLDGNHIALAQALDARAFSDRPRG
ncbi:MAG TPA: VOC family protein [Steroidobacteraceae bacterium]|nr:VOC family protein [Steroidobacteraceae bacterium]